MGMVDGLQESECGMKTQYSLDYLSKKYAPTQLHDWSRTRIAELSEKTGLRWGVNDGAGHRTFQVIFDFQMVIEATPDAETIEAIKLAAHQERLYTGFRFLTVVQLARMTGLPLAKVMTACVWMIREKMAHPSVNRRGQATYISVHL
jgi:hypothetical protein